MASLTSKQTLPGFSLLAGLRGVAGFFLAIAESFQLAVAVSREVDSQGNLSPKGRELLGLEK